ncbi:MULTISPECIES: hypothetical protein [unclassified Bradyrhizobium]|uniref:hypothetical protein n=1 Tax=unclassified Bradyrhizobium TaxID=2631580 RepID=UPI00211EC947|nr:MULTISPECIES: hypothetical protein [unclassified Bradyrhizobium]MDD1534572.1 hypothetical protein [Bradyrhizobium sp. WBOS8]MDD1581436.1 hypothetical protein [Bradyrhizobium sp. WBOS4]UUO49725.1 hypothetical protein DCM78_24125 [Bradyrhizobium sp. WBOS04]UUO58490.1 hypothetical protein DCM80_04400 [Bradyrhizobium sp. WBOS08]
MVSPDDFRDLGGANSGGGGAPAWLWLNDLGLAPTIYVDTQLNHYWLDGQQFASEAELNAAAFTSMVSSGIARTGSYVDPSATERITNGDFTVDATGWTAENSSVAATGGELVVTGAGAANPTARQDIATVDREAYVVTAKGRRGTMTPTNTACGVAVQSGASLRGSSTTTLQTAQHLRYIFASDGASTHSILARAIGANPTGTAIFDDISVKRCVPFKGFANGNRFGRVWGKTPASLPTSTQCVKTIGVDHANNCWPRIEYTATGHIQAKFTLYAGTGPVMDLGYYPPDTEFVVRWAVTPRPVAWVEGYNARLYNATTAPLGAGVIRVGRDFAGSTFTGQIYGYAVGIGADILGDVGHLMGDSLANGAGGVINFQTQLLALGGFATLGSGYGGSALEYQIAQDANFPHAAKCPLIWYDLPNFDTGGGPGTSTTGYLNEMKAYVDSLGIPGNKWAMIIPHISAEMSAVVAQCVRDMRGGAAASILGAEHVFDCYEVLPHGNDGNGADVVDNVCLFGYPSVGAGEVHLNQTYINNVAVWAAGMMRASGYIGAAQPT